MTRATESKFSVLRLAPPLCITATEVDQLAGIVAESVIELEREIGK